MTARLLLLANALGIAIYILWQGVEKFGWESFGTWMMSPMICIRLCPEPLKSLMLHAAGPLFCFLFCLLPILMFAASFFLAVQACRKESWPIAMAACFLTTTVFVVYHSVKHMGIQFILI